MSFDILCLDVQKLIISSCDIQTLGNLSQVSKGINRIISNDREDFKEKCMEKIKLEMNALNWSHLFLRCCFFGGPIAVMKYLLIVKEVNPSMKFNYPIREACENGHTKVVKLLLSDPRVDPSDLNNYTLEHSCMNGHTEVVKLLLSDPRVDPNNLPIVLASGNGHAEVVKLLLSDPRFQSSNELPLTLSAENGHTEVVKLLLSDPRTSNYSDYVLKSSCKYGHLEVVKLLLSVPWQFSGNVNELLIIAAENGHSEVVKLLLSESREQLRASAWLLESPSLSKIALDPDSASEDETFQANRLWHLDPSAERNKAIRLASYNGHVEVVRELLKDERVDPSDYNNQSLVWASEKGNFEVAKLLLSDKRVNINILSEEDIQEIMN